MCNYDSHKKNQMQSMEQEQDTENGWNRTLKRLKYNSGSKSNSKNNNQVKNLH